MTEKEKEEKQQILIDKVQEFCLMDDIYMNYFFDDHPELVQYILRIILKSDLIVKSVRIQEPFKNLYGRSTVLDIVAVDETGKKFDIEIQNDLGEAAPERAEYHVSCLVRDSLMPKQPFSELSEIVVIFILDGDYFNDGKPIYTVNYTVNELKNQSFGGKTKIIYVNGKYKGNDDIGKLMHDFKCKKPADMHSNLLKERADEIKNTERGRESMCKIMRELNAVERAEGFAEGMEKGREEGMKEKSIENALNLLKNGKLALEDISLCTGLSLDNVKELAEQI